ncbi:ATP-dependent DNA helicase RecG [Actinopolymorpha sp. NPDC004070]|uniref:ATP-dependent DNA helicase RecG n=1 Tax=Actinopolymorpha sp. NPDC004070 TaxID=3154548 RepID=UPI0033A69782
MPLSGFAKAEVLKAMRDRLELATLGDLLRHYPRRYVQRGELTNLRGLSKGEEVTVQAEIKSVTSRSMKNRRGNLVEVVVTDGSGELKLTFFNQRWRANQLQQGMRGLFAGKVDSYHGAMQLSHPHFVLFGDRGGDFFDAESIVEEFTGALMPIYPSTAKAATWSIAQIVRSVLDALGEVPDPIPARVRERRGLLGLREAFEAVHRPESFADVEAARKRFRFEEAFVLQTELARRRSAARQLAARPRVAEEGGLRAAFEARLPFALTDGQRAVGADIEADLARDHPMQRLLQGEVGSGKTVCALRAMLTVVDAGGQAALLAPTEVLAQQHYRSITALLGPLAERGFIGGADDGTRVALLTGGQGTAARRKALLEVASGEAGVVVGTHALLEDKVQFADLGLVVVDEQHRFGVEQRAALTGKAGGVPPHVLVMTATPIPRTVAMTVFGDLEVSTLSELPSGRAPIQTNVVPLAEKPDWIDHVWRRVRQEVGAGRQVYVVCPRIGDDEGAGGAGGEDTDTSDRPVDAEADGTREMTAVVALAAELAEGPLAGLRVELLHGRQPSDAKDAVMRRFAAGEIDVLVATTVIEVGVDVPNASTMVVMDADWFGVSQLHQLRGRVGRGGHPGLCLLVTGAAEGSPARARMDAVASTTDGFELSRIDLEHRREGDVLGADQSGRRSSLRMLAVIRDEKVIAQARTDAAEVVATDPGLRGEPALAEAVAALYDDDRADYLEKT